MTISTTIISSYFLTALARKVFVLEEEDNDHAPLMTKVQQQPKPIVKDQEIF